MTQLGAYKAALTALAGGGGVLSLVNPEGVDLIVTDLILDITTAGAGGATADAGIAATGATSSDTLIDGVALDGIGVFDNVDNKGTNGGRSVLWPAAQYLTISPSIDPTTLVGNAYIRWIRR